jgi:hypothetical protein
MRCAPPAPRGAETVRRTPPRRSGPPPPMEAGDDQLRQPLLFASIG